MDINTIDKNVLKENELEANSIIAKALLLSVLAIIFAAFLIDLGVYDSPEFFWEPVMLFDAVLLVAGVIVYKYYAYNKTWIKFVMLTIIIFVYAVLDVMFTASVDLFICIPVILSIRYFNRKFTIHIAILSFFIFAISCVLGANYGLLDLNCMEYPLGTVIRMDKTTWLIDAVKGIKYDQELHTGDVLLYGFIPKGVIFFIAAVICANVAEQGKRLVLKQQKLSENNSKIETELEMAASIQSSMLPNMFPAFPDRKEFDIYASMNPAKAVGGDFYDFFMIDDDHLCMVIADVSGKGVPAALFMMISKTIISNVAVKETSPSKILEIANEKICAGNENTMFVTVWIGILEISTGRLVSANAGHEDPAIMTAEGRFELYKEKHGFVLGGMEGMKYKEFETTLLPGSKLFVYTDGVPEATNSNEELYGTARMVDALNIMSGYSPKILLEGMQCAVDEFVDGAEQFDDLTMLALEYKGTSNS